MITRRYAFNSEGTVTEVTYEKIKVHIDTLQSRLAELEQFSDKMTALLKENGIVVSSGFDMMIQPFGNEEQLLFFTKEQLPSDGEIVKQAGFAKNNPSYFAEHPEQEHLLKSIHGTVENGKVTWYLLRADFLCLTRNIVDRKWIAIQHKTLPYHQFVKELSDIAIRKEDMERETSDRYRLYSKGEGKKTPSLILQTAVIRNAQYQQTVDTCLNLYRVLAMQKRDKFSNETTICLWRINYEKPEHSAFYQSYVEWKKFLRQKSETAYGVCYRNHCICFTDKGKTVRIDVTGSNPVFIAGGYEYQNLDSLKEAYENGTIWKEKPWFKKIIPYIVERKTEKVYYYKKKEDVLGLFTKQDKPSKGRNV